MSWLKSAVQSHRHGRTKSSLPFFNSQPKLEITVPRIQTPSQNEIFSLRPRYIENVDKDSFDHYQGAVSESTNERSHLRRSHENEASYRTLPNAVEPTLWRKPINESRPSTGSQGSLVSSSNTPATQSTSSFATVTPQEPDSRSTLIPRKLPTVNNEIGKDPSKSSENRMSRKGPPVEEAIINTEPALLAKDPFFFERIQFHVENAEDSFTRSDWDTALDNIQVAYDIFRGVDIFLMIREDEKFLLLQRLIICRCMSILAARFYSESVLHLSNQWNALLKKEGLRDAKSQPWVDLVRILAYIRLEKYEEAQESCQKYLRPDYSKDGTNAETNSALNAYGFWLMAEILTKRGKSIEAEFYTSKIPKNMDEGIHFNWVSHCLSPPEPHIQQAPKTVSFSVGPRGSERAASHSWNTF